MKKIPRGIAHRREKVQTPGSAQRFAVEEVALSHLVAFLKLS